jgi:hypothetical protein
MKTDATDSRTLPKLLVVDLNVGRQAKESRKSDKTDTCSTQNELELDKSLNACYIR